MPAQAQPRMQVIRKEDKEAKLRDFLLKALDTLPLGAAPGKITVVARSLESPVLKAIAGIVPELSATRCTLEIILTLIEGPATLDFGGLDVSARHAHLPRLIDAHEQMVLASDCVWIGDCMRRDPSKRDAFELFASPGGTTALWAKTSFARLWERGEPLDLNSAAQEIEAESVVDELIPVAVELVPATTVSTRH